ncbi:hypothetical protein B7P43_G14043 [Cryptotermes secundus]|uniref:Uncharacterized protein n=1 Tax=Cryptotermes secundus TaxID=105785 RepID=A0A2J7QEF2_9NEOP|nr:hypothetical protein B7P43_G14043 [Cryptotermes secundus]
MSILLWLGTNPDLTQAIGKCGYRLKKYDEATGIYYERKGQVNLCSTEWEVVVYIDLNRISSQSLETEQYRKQGTAVQNWTDCYHFPEIARNKHIAKIREAIDTLQHYPDIVLESITNVRKGDFSTTNCISKINHGHLNLEFSIIS